MSERATSALPGAHFKGFVSVQEAGLRGMVTIRCDLASPKLAAAVEELGLNVPAQRKVESAGEMALAWMSPDELLLMAPHERAEEVAQQLAQALQGEFATIANVSDARAVFTLEGAALRDALAKLCPVDFGTLGPGDIRRTRAAQIAAAIWFEAEDRATLVCFRSVAQYMFDLLSAAAAPGSEPGLYS